MLKSLLVIGAPRRVLSLLCVLLSSVALAQLSVSATGEDPNCFGLDNGRVFATPVGGQPPYSFAWSNGEMTDTIRDLVAGTYTVSVTDNAGAEASASATLTEPDRIEASVTDAEECEAPFVIAAEPRGGTPPYRYRWSTTDTTRSVSVPNVGVYCVTVTDDNLCGTVACKEIERNPPSVTVTVVDVLCVGDDNGSLTARVSEGVPPYTYDWTNGQTGQTIDGLAPGGYRVTLTDALGCTATATGRVQEPPALDLSIRVNGENCPGQANVFLAALAGGGTPDYDFLWSTGATSDGVGPLAAGTYGLTVTDANGCTTIQSVTLVDRDSVTLTIIGDTLLCGAGSTGTLMARPTNGDLSDYVYVWSNGATGPEITGVAPGTYSVTATDEEGCEGTATAEVRGVDVQVSLAGTQVSCPEGADGTATVTVSGGDEPYTYLWSTGATNFTIEGLGAGVYGVTVTDANNCKATGEIEITEVPGLSIEVDVDQPDCAGDTTGSIEATLSQGTPPYEFAWSTGATTATLDGVGAGTYSLTVTDANNCSQVREVNVNEPPALELDTDVTPVFCQGDTTGAIDLSVGGGTRPYFYRWSTGALTQDIAGLPAGSYEVTVTDANDCKATISATVGSNNTIDVQATIMPIGCPGDATGAIDVTVSGGSGDYTFAWNTGATTEDLTGLTAGEYGLTVTDVNGCSAVVSFIVEEPEDLSLMATAPDIVCGGTATGTITAQATGGTPPYRYAFSSGDTGSVVSELPAGTYDISVVDANSCETTIEVTLDELPELGCEVIVSNEPTTGNNGSLSVIVDGGTEPYIYEWSTGATTPTISDLPSGDYSVTVTDDNDCTTVCSASLRALSGIGDFVWLDQNANGQQDEGEPGIEDFPVLLKNEDGEIIDSTRTDVDGRYDFMGLEPGTYSILFDAPENAITTALNQGEDATDSDADPDMGGMTANYTLAPGEFNMTVDAGFFARPGGAIVDPCNCLDNNTNDQDGQFSEIIEVRADPGQTWTITERQNMFLLESGQPPVAPIPVPLGTELIEVEPGVYQYEFRLVDSFLYSSVLSNGVFELTISNFCIYPTVEFTALPPETLCRFEVPFALEGMGSIPGEVIFTVNGDTVDSLDPMTLPLGEVTIEGRLIPDGPEDCIVNISREVFLIDDCDAKIGDTVFFDRNANGIQEAGEGGIAGVKVTVDSEDGSYTDMTTTDETGMYMFFVPPGTYKVTFAPVDEQLSASPSDQGEDDARDSDVNRATLMTDFYTVGPDEVNLTIDAGFFLPCIDNVDDPGTIGFDQAVCGPGNTPNTLVELTPAIGGEGELEYLWMMNTENPNLDITYWSPIPNSNTPDYTPGPVDKTTFYTRCVRRAECPYLESNVLTIEVDDVAVANVDGPAVLCVGEEGIFRAVGSGGGLVSWTFPGNASVSSSNSPTVRVTWQSFGFFRITLEVTRNGCTSRQEFGVQVVRNPSRCDEGLLATGSVNSLQRREVSIEWSVPEDGSDYQFELQRSVGGSAFNAIGEMSDPTFMTGEMGYYRMDDVSPVIGRARYRVLLRDAEYGDLASNIIELNLAPATEAFGRVFPNPATGEMLYVELTEIPRSTGLVSLQLFDARGSAVTGRVFPNGQTGVINLPTTGQAAGVYFLRINVDGETETHRVVVD